MTFLVNRTNPHRKYVPLSSYFLIDCRIFQQKNIPDIIKEALADFGQPFEMNVSTVLIARKSTSCSSTRRRSTL